MTDESKSRCQMSFDRVLGQLLQNDEVLGKIHTDQQIDTVPAGTVNALTWVRHVEPRRVGDGVHADVRPGRVAVLV